ncbi:unnamed protein product [Amoebophrya sp. A120]|nr:unnamed protein product [Amoebophrya sp. A120]|eukprot:GSA120T00023299001.1
MLLRGGRSRVPAAGRSSGAVTTILAAAPGTTPTASFHLSKISTTTAILSLAFALVPATGEKMLTATTTSSVLPHAQAVPTFLEALVPWNGGPVEIEVTDRIRSKKFNPACIDCPLYYDLTYELRPATLAALKVPRTAEDGKVENLTTPPVEAVEDVPLVNPYAINYGAGHANPWIPRLDFELVPARNFSNPDEEGTNPAGGEAGGDPGVRVSTVEQHERKDTEFDEAHLDGTQTQIATDAARNVRAAEPGQGATASTSSSGSSSSAFLQLAAMQKAAAQQQQQHELHELEMNKRFNRRVAATTTTTMRNGRTTSTARSSRSTTSAVASTMKIQKQLVKQQQAAVIAGTAHGENSTSNVLHSVGTNGTHNTSSNNATTPEPTTTLPPVPRPGLLHEDWHVVPCSEAEISCPAALPLLRSDADPRARCRTPDADLGTDDPEEQRVIDQERAECVAACCAAPQDYVDAVPAIELWRVRGFADQDLHYKGRLQTDQTRQIWNAEKTAVEEWITVYSDGACTTTIHTGAKYCQDAGAADQTFALQDPAGGTTEPANCDLSLHVCPRRLRSLRAPDRIRTAMIGLWDEEAAAAQAAGRENRYLVPAEDNDEDEDSSSTSEQTGTTTTPPPPSPRQPCGDMQLYPVSNVECVMTRGAGWQPSCPALPSSAAFGAQAIEFDPVPGGVDENECKSFRIPEGVRGGEAEGTRNCRERCNAVHGCKFFFVSEFDDGWDEGHGIQCVLYNNCPTAATYAPSNPRVHPGQIYQCVESGGTITSVPAPLPPAPVVLGSPGTVNARLMFDTFEYLRLHPRAKSRDVFQHLPVASARLLLDAKKRQFCEELHLQPGVLDENSSEQADLAADPVHAQNVQFAYDGKTSKCSNVLKTKQYVLMGTVMEHRGSDTQFRQVHHMQGHACAHAKVFRTTISAAPEPFSFFLPNKHLAVVTCARDVTDQKGEAPLLSQVSAETRDQVRRFINNDHSHLKNLTIHVKPDLQKFFAADGTGNKTTLEQLIYHHFHVAERNRIFFFCKDPDHGGLKICSTDEETQEEKYTPSGHPGTPPTIPLWLQILVDGTLFLLSPILIFGCLGDPAEKRKQATAAAKKAAKKEPAVPPAAAAV